MSSAPRAGTPGPADAVAPLADALAGPGWGVAPGFLAPPLVAALRTRIAALDAAGGLRPAAVGVAGARAVRPEVRGDRLAWIDPDTPAERTLLERLEALRLGLNERLALGLFDLECHYAHYPSGGRYARHRDRSPRGAERVVSVVMYLNDAWRAADGGALVLYPPSGPVTVLPEGGTLVAFLSAELEHEVCATLRDRLSVVGWYRRRTHVVR